jgi:hypothetical protein
MHKSNLLSTAACIPATLILALLIFATGSGAAVAMSKGENDCIDNMITCMNGCAPLGGDQYDLCIKACRAAANVCLASLPGGGPASRNDKPNISTDDPPNKPPKGVTGNSPPPGSILDSGSGLPQQGPARTGGGRRD